MLGLTVMELNTPLTVDEIDFRIQSVNNGKYATILAYKDARADMNRLDAVYGVDGWQKEYREINGRLYCRVGIYSDTLKQWVWKEDVGTESNTEKEKGQASDAFKRACFNLGIGRELYDYPVISFKFNDNEVSKYGDKWRPNWDVKINEWKWATQFDDNGKIKFIGVKDTSGKLRFKWGEYSE